MKIDIKNTILIYHIYIEIPLSGAFSINYLKESKSDGVSVSSMYNKLLILMMHLFFNKNLCIILKI